MLDVFHQDLEGKLTFSLCRQIAGRLSLLEMRFATRREVQTLPFILGSTFVNTAQCEYVANTKRCYQESCEMHDGSLHGK